MTPQLKNPKTFGAFISTHSGGSIARKPKTVMAAQNMQLAKVGAALQVILKTAGIDFKTLQKK